MFEIVFGNGKVYGVGMDGIDNLKHFGTEEMTA